MLLSILTSLHIFEFESNLWFNLIWAVALIEDRFGSLIEIQSIHGFMNVWGLHRHEILIWWLSSLEEMSFDLTLVHVVKLIRIWLIVFLKLGIILLQTLSLEHALIYLWNMIIRFWWRWLISSEFSSLLSFNLSIQVSSIQSINIDSSNLIINDLLHGDLRNNSVFFDIISWFRIFSLYKNRLSTSSCFYKNKWRRINNLSFLNNKNLKYKKYINLQDWNGWANNKSTIAWGMCLIAITYGFFLALSLCFLQSSISASRYLGFKVESILKKKSLSVFFLEISQSSGI